MSKVNEEKTFSKMLVAVYEPKKFSEIALNYAIRVAGDYDARLVILYIIRGNANLQTVNLPTHIVRLKKEAQAYLVKVSEKIQKDSSKGKTIRIKTEIIASIRLADAIVSYAKANHIELIIIKTRGRSKLKSIVLGSLAADVMRHAHCPVLIVK